MKIRSKEALADRVYDDLSWRRKELSVFQGFVKKAEPHAQGALLRSSLALLYAHWEGSVKFNAHAYLCYLASLRLSFQQLRPELAAVALRARLNELTDSNKSELHTHVIQQIRDNGGERANVPSTREAIRTNSNLNFSTLCEILSSLGFDYSRYGDKADLIDEQLVAVRNRIAHGEEEYVRLTEWEEIKKNIFQVMEDIADQIVLGADNQTYLTWRA